MDLWIRSQNKSSLTKITCVYISDDDGNGEYIMGTVDIKGHILLGRYKSKERALEIIDEIQKLLTPVVSYTPYVKEDVKPEYTYKHFVSKGGETEIIQFSTYVYEMPKE